ncbi:MAG: sensor histidine kinase [Bacteroidetes bacterium]|nr:MAG: sensor histidine kinase [Bacteroidota bacterium]TAG89246.1 MAG: sensor histidine kinase [Bacteroidota bacterium]
MQNNTIRWVIALATFSIIGIFVTQMYWVRKAFDLKEKQFNQSVNIALRKVGEQLAKLNEVALNPKIVNQASSNYFVVNVNTAIDANSLEHLLQIEFDKINLELDYEYGIYDCSSNQMVYGKYISADRSKTQKPSSDLPAWKEYTYYFVILFPNKSTYLLGQMDIWLFSSLVLLIVVIFFSYSLFVILKQKRLSEIQRDFINNMTHEFKTPISTIALSADLISNPKIITKPDSLLNYANIIKTQNTRLKNQIEKVLQMAMMEKAKLQLNLEKLNLITLTQEVIKNFNLEDKAKIIFNCHLEEDKCNFMADKVHFTNIVYNLLDNAIKYVADDKTPEITINIRYNIINYNTKGLIFSIKDNGIGIDKKHQKRIFEKFYRVPTGNIHNVKGFGLGLNYVQHIIKAHHWKIRLESELGKGSNFMIVGINDCQA